MKTNDQLQIEKLHRRINYLVTKKLAYFGFLAVTAVIAWGFGAARSYDYVHTAGVVEGRYIERRAVIREFIRRNCLPWFKDGREHPRDKSKDTQLPRMLPGIIMACTVPKDTK